VSLVLASNEQTPMATAVGRWKSGISSEPRVFFFTCRRPSIPGLERRASGAILRVRGISALCEHQLQ
jgi:hypothetical protein